MEPAVEPPVEEAPGAVLDVPGQALAAFYDRRAPAALAYCARLCEPELIAEAVEEAFGAVFSAASGSSARSDEELDRLLRDAVHGAAAKRASYSTSAREADRAYDALAGDEAPALGRSLLAEILESPPEVAPPPPPAPSPPPPPERKAPPPKPSTLVALPPPAARRRRPRLPRLAAGWRRRVAIVLGVIGLLLLAEVLVTLVWKEPFTAYLTAQTQDDLSKQLDNRHVALQGSDQQALAAISNPDARTRKRMALLAQHLDAAVPDGEALGRINIDRLGVHYVFVQGTDSGSLQKGPGHYHGNTLLPGQGGTVGIAGHRTTYEAPFREIPSLKAGDRISLTMPYGRFTYEVMGHRVVPADYRLAFTSPGASGERLVLSACHPLYDAKQRILVEAKLVGSQPLGPAVVTSTPAPHLSAKEIAHRRFLARFKLLGHRQLGPGVTGPDVRELQRLLGMPVTGLFDPNTTAAVVAFQRDHGLPQVGIVGRQTKVALARRTHPPSRPPTPAPVPQPPTKYAPSP